MRKLAMVLLISTAVGSPAFAQSTAHCAAGLPQAEAAAQAKALLASVSAAMDRQQAEMEAGIRDASARMKWTEQERARFLRTVFQSPPNAAFDRQIALLSAELRTLLQASQRGEIQGTVAECRHIARLRELVVQLRSVYEQQSAYVSQQLRTVKPAR